MIPYPKLILAALAASLQGLPCASVAQSLTPPAPDGQREQLRARLAANPTDYDSSFAYVRESIEARDFEAAITTLERMLFFNPTLSRAKYELGSLYFRLASHAKAVRHFEDAQADPDLDPQLRLRIAAYLPMARKELQPDRVYGLLQAGVRFNSNPSSLPSTSALAGLGLALPAGVSTKGAASGYLLGDVRYVHDFQNERGDTIEARAQGYFSHPFNSSQLDVGLFDLAIGPKLVLAPEALPGATINPYVAFGVASLGGSLYATTLGGGVNLRFPLSPFLWLEPGAEWRRADVRDPAPVISQTTLNTGSLATGRLAMHWSIADRISLDGQVFYTRNQTSNALLSSSQQGAQASLKVDFDPLVASIPLLWSVTPYVRYATTRFDQFNPLLLNPARRRDSQWRVGSQLDMPVSSTWGLTALLEYKQNQSSVAQFRSSGWSTALGANIRF